VGGGPAGSVAAMLLARAGYEVTLLERQYFPRAKPCGDCLSPGANPVLKRLGLWDDVMHARPALLNGWRLTSPGNVSFHALFRDISEDNDVSEALAVSRDRLDAVLLSHARRAGVNIRHGLHVTDVLRADAGRVIGVRAECDAQRIEIKARLTIGADGLRSVIARRLNAHGRRPKLRKASFTIHVDLPERRVVGEMYVAENACLGIAPVHDEMRQHNVTLVVNHGSYDKHAGTRAIVTAGMARFGFELPSDCGEILTSGPFDWPVRQTAYDGAVLIGDAAGYYDPFTGQGIFQAMYCAEMLAEHAINALRNRTVRRNDIRNFELAHARMMRPARRVQRIVEFVCARPHLADRIFGKFARDEALARVLVGVTSDLFPAARLLSPRLLARLAA
jgi:flavin-dependent dehydrogenase